MVTSIGISGTVWMSISLMGILSDGSMTYRQVEGIEECRDTKLWPVVGGPEHVSMVDLPKLVSQHVREAARIIRARSCGLAHAATACAGVQWEASMCIEFFFSGVICGLGVGVLLGYCLPHRLPRREEKQPEIDRLVEQFQELFRQINRDKEA